MSIVATVRGNLTGDPESKTVKVDGESRRIVELRVFSDEYRRRGDELIQDENKCIGIDVTIWAERLGDQVLAHLKKGARVEVRGSMVPNRYKDRETHEPRMGLQLDAESVALLLNRVESIRFAPSRGPRENREDGEESAFAG